MENEKKDKKKKIICLFLCAVMLVTGSIAGTLAYLSARTATLTNVFTYGNVAIELTESKGTAIEGGSREFKIIPGQAITKDPMVTVKQGGEKSFVFVKLEEKNWDEGLTYMISDGWKPLATGNEGIVYYREADPANRDVKIPVLKDNTINVDSTVSAKDPAPSLAITAYAVQNDGQQSVNDAWGIAKELDKQV